MSPSKVILTENWYIVLLVFILCIVRERGVPVKQVTKDQEKRHAELT